MAGKTSRLRYQQLQVLTTARVRSLQTTNDRPLRTKQLGVSFPVVITTPECRSRPSHRTHLGNPLPTEGNHQRSRTLTTVQDQDVPVVIPENIQQVPFLSQRFPKKQQKHVTAP